MILDKPTKVCLDKQEILISEFDFEKKKNTNSCLIPDAIESLAFISDSSSISKGALKKLEGKNICFISKGTPIAVITWLEDGNKLHYYSQKMAQLPKSKQKKLGFAFCKGVCLGRIHEIRRLNEKRKDAFLTERIKQMTILERQLIKVYKDGEKLKGLEGNITKHFFACIRYLLPKETGFEERNKDGADIYNSLLNAAHGLLRAKIAKILWAEGINSSFGFLHFQKDKNKPFLVWDFAELWIPYVDKLCFYAINKKVFSEKDLIKAKEGNGKWLNGNGWKKFYKLFNERIDEKQIEKKVLEFKEYLDMERTRIKHFSWTKKGGDLK